VEPLENRRLLAASALVLTITDHGSPADVGTDVTFNISVTKPVGNPLATGVQLTDVIPTDGTSPPDVVFDTVSYPAGWSRSGVSHGGTGTLALTDSFPLAGGATASFTLYLTVAPAALSIDVPSNTVNASSTNTPSATPETAYFDVNPTTVLLTQTTTPANTGGLETVTLTASNIGGHNAGDVAIVYAGPDYLGTPFASFASASYPANPSLITETDPGVGNLVTPLDPVTFTIPVLPAGDSASVQVTTSIPSGSVAFVADSHATVSSPTDFGSPHNSDASFNVYTPAG
jgi:hypothetical protein